MLVDHQTLGVPLKEVVRIAFTSLLDNKIRALLTMLGVIIGVAAVVALLSLGDGVQQAVTSQIQSNGTNIITIVPGAPDTRRSGTSGPIKPLTMDDAKAIEALHLPL